VPRVIDDLLLLVVRQAVLLPRGVVLHPVLPLPPGAPAAVPVVI
jgi:hypothetical protein